MHENKYNRKEDRSRITTVPILFDWTEQLASINVSGSDSRTKSNGVATVQQHQTGSN